MRDIVFRVESHGMSQGTSSCFSPPVFAWCSAAKMIGTWVNIQLIEYTEIPQEPSSNIRALYGCPILLSFVYKS